MKICLVATGGTIGSREDTDGVIKFSDAATEQIADIVEADSVFDEFKIHSERMKISDLSKIRKIVERALKTKPDGIIVSHGTDTLAYSSAYLAYAFCNVKIPIVICSADQPLTKRDSNGFDVLRSAKMFLRSGKAGVYVAYKNPDYAPRIHHAARLLPAHLHEYFYNSIGDSVFCDTGLLRGMDFDLQEHKVLCITPYVGMDYSSFDVKGYSAVVQCAYHSGTVNTSDFNEFASRNSNIPIFLTTGKSRYDGQVFVDNVVPCQGITQSALYIKLLVGLKNNVKDLASFALKNACGEIVVQ